MAFLDNNIINQLKEVFKKLDKEIKIVNFVSETNEKSKELKSFLEEFKAVSDKIIIEQVDFDNEKDKVNLYNIENIPAMTFVKSNGEVTNNKFYGIPGGHEINSFVITLLNIAEIGRNFDAETLKRLDNIDKEVNLKVFVTLACHHCPDVVVATQMMALKNKNIKAEMLDISLYPDLVEKFEVKSVPTVIYNNSEFTIGAKTANEILNKIESL